MARIQKTTIIQEDGAARKFVIKQMPATHGFLFGMKVMKFLCTNDSGTSIPQGNVNVSQLFINAIGGMDLKSFESIMDEALECCTYTGGAKEIVCTKENLDAILTDPLNVFELFKESLEVNLSFIERALPESLKEKMRGVLPSLAGLITQTSSPDTK